MDCDWFALDGGSVILYDPENSDAWIQSDLIVELQTPENEERPRQ